MCVDQAGERAPHGFGFRGIDAEPGAAGFGLKVEHIEAAPRAGNDSRQAACIAAVGVARLRNIGARCAVEQFQAARDGVGRIARFHRLRISGINEDQSPGRIAQPHRRRQFFDQRA